MKKILLGSTACLLAIGLYTQVHAQAAGQVEEVTITAQKRKESLSKVAVTADVVNANQLKQLSVTDISDLSKVVPAVSINGSTNGRVPYAMRGVSTTANEGNVGLESGVGVEVDGVPIPSDSHAAQQIVDLDNVQVLEGPQATLGGRAASAGLIDMITRSPKDTFQGQVDGTFTSDGEKRGSVFVTGPLFPGLDFSVSGYGEQTPYPIKNIYDDHYTTQGATGVRAKLQYKPDALLTATLAGHFAESESYGDNFVYTYLTPGSTLGPSLGLTGATAMPGVNVNSSNLETNSIAQNIGARITDRDVSLNVSYQWGDLTLGSTTAYQSETERDVQDLFDISSYFWNDLKAVAGFPFPYFYNTQTIHDHLHQISQEFKIASPSDAKINYVAGVYLSDSSYNYTWYRSLTPALENIIAQPETTTYDIYGRVTDKLTSQFSITGGLRFNDDQLRYAQDQIAFETGNFPTDFTDNANLRSSGHTNSGALVGDIDAQYFLNARDMLYATYARGYAPQAYNTASPLYSDAKLTPVARMDVNHFEIGSKGRYLDGQLALNADVFYTRYDNYQIETFTNLPGVENPPLNLVNAPEAQTHGVEISGTYRPTVNTTLGFNAAYIDATFVKYDDGQCWFSQGDTTGTSCYTNATGTPDQNVSGKPLPNSPPFKFVLNGEQRFPLTSIPYDVVVGAVYTYRSRAQMLPDQSPYGFQQGFGLLNLSLGLESQDGKYALNGFVNNVTNQVYYTDIEDFWNTVWGTTAGRNETIIAQPGRDAKRYEGVRFTAKF